MEPEALVLIERDGEAQKLVVAWPKVDLGKRKPAEVLADEDEELRAPQAPRAVAAALPTDGAPARGVGAASLGEASDARGECRMMPGPRNSEAGFQRAVVELAERCGWRVMHVRRSKVRKDQWATSTSHAGWPDLTLWHPGRKKVLFVELKRDEGILTPAQRVTVQELRVCGLDVRVWRPAAWAEIEATLKVDS